MKQNEINRRNFLKAVGAAGLGSVVTGSEVFAEPNQPTTPAKTQKPHHVTVPRRKLGKLTQPSDKGPVPVEVPCLSLGTMFNVMDNQAALIESLKWGVNYWDSAYSYAGGNSELGIGKFLSRNPKVRKNLFITSKASDAKNIANIEKRLQESLRRMNTKYIDLYYGVHGLSDPSRLTDELKQWGESAKKRGLIRFFGVSTHKNMARCLSAVAKVNWIDAVLVKYNFREMQNPRMQAAIDACYKAGIGLTAMKTVRGQKITSEEDRRLTDHFIKRGLTVAQAKIKVVMQDKRISSVCVGRGNVRELKENIAVALDKTKLTSQDMDVFRQIAGDTCSEYCAGCAHICDAALPQMPYVSDIMRYMMYYNRYDEKNTAMRLFAGLPTRVRECLLTTDYQSAERQCPQRMPISLLMAEAARKLA